MSSQFVTKVVQDHYGFIWVGTQEGLNNSDGHSIQLYTKATNEKFDLGGSFIQDLLLDKKRNLLWVLSNFSNIHAIDLKAHIIKKTISVDQYGRSISKNWIRNLALNKDTLWFGGVDILASYDLRNDLFLDTRKIEIMIKETAQLNISQIRVDDEKQIWLMNENDAIYILNPQHEVISKIDLLTKKQKSQGHKLSFRDAILIDQNIFIATSKGLQQYSITKLTPTLQMPYPSTALYRTEVSCLGSITSGQLLIGTLDGLYSWDYLSNNLQELGEQRVKDTYAITYQPTLNLVWIGTQFGLYRGDSEKQFTGVMMSSIEGDIIKNMYSLLPYGDSLLLAGGSNGVYQIDLVRSISKQVLGESTNLSLFKDKNEDVILSNLSGTFFHSGGNTYPIGQIYPELKPCEDDFFNQIIQYNDSLILMSRVNKNGIIIWNSKSKRIVDFPGKSIEGQSPPNIELITNMFLSKSGLVYVLTAKQIIRFYPIELEHRTNILPNIKSNETLSNFMDMNESPDSYFIGTYGDGLVETDKQFNVKKIYTTQDGLSNNCIYRIFNIKDEKMLITTNNGLSILDLKTKKFKTYYEGDGLHGNGFEQFCGYQKDNKIYVGGPGGFTIVNTDLLPDSSVAPILYPTGITINTPDGKIDSTHLEMSSFTIPNDAFKTTLKFVSPDYKNPDRMKYRYKIDELSEEWVELGNQNFVDLIGVNPGKYHFEVIATNSEGTDSKPLKMTLDFLPKWYQTSWFKVLLLLLVAGLVYWVQRYRMIQIKKQQTIRKEIANDLHDDIGSTLNSLKIFAHLAQSDTNNKSHIEQIEESISEATVGLRDMIWVLEDEQDSVYEIMERIKKFASPICMAHDIEFVGTVNATSEKPIPKKIKRNIFLVAKECINNSVKYAECSRIEVVLAYSKSKLQLTIEDNGKGFDCDEITKGKGLDSMEYRANQVEFNCDIQSRVGSGTITTMQGTIG